jgi:AcrR family transcriptional regulator
VPRTRPPDRFERLRDAGLRVFAAKGLRRARMADVARAMGVSPGALYNWVESKEALFYWLVERGDDAAPAKPPAVLPIPTPRPGAIERRLRERLQGGFLLPSLEAALTKRRVADPRSELEAILRELWDRVARSRRPLAVLERSAIDAPELYRIWFATARRALFARLAEYVARRSRADDFRRVADPALAARYLVETIAWFARHRYGDPDPALLPDDEVVREAVLPLLVASLVPDRARPNPGGRR